MVKKIAIWDEDIVSGTSVEETPVRNNLSKVGLIKQPDLKLKKEGTKKFKVKEDFMILEILETSKLKNPNEIALRTLAQNLNRVYREVKHRSEKIIKLLQSSKNELRALNKVGLKDIQR